MRLNVDKGKLLFYCAIFLYKLRCTENNSCFYFITVIMMMQLVTKSTHENTIPEVFPSNWFLSNACYMIWHDFSIHLLDVATMISFIVTVSAYVGRKKYVQFPIVNTCITQIWVIYFQESRWAMITYPIFIYSNRLHSS